MGRKPFRFQRLLSRSFTADTTAPRAARHALDELNGHIDPALKDDIRLLVSEVITNSVIHAQPRTPGEVDLEVWASDAVVRVAITDRGPGFVAAKNPRGGERSGVVPLAGCRQLRGRGAALVGQRKRRRRLAAEIAADPVRGQEVGEASADPRLG